MQSAVYSEILNCIMTTRYMKMIPLMLRKMLFLILK